MQNRTTWLPAIVGLFAFTGCGGTEEAARVKLPVTTTASILPTATTDLGYDVELSSLRVAISTVQFTIEGEMHQDGRGSVAPRLLTPPPHPGHSAGGEVTGELLGDFVLVWNGQPQPTLGDGTLIVGDYHGANFTFRTATDADGLAVDDPLLGHTFHLAGTARRDGMTRPFAAVLDVEPDTAVVGAVFDDVIRETSRETLALEFFPVDPFEHDTAFDGIDFFQLPEQAGVLDIAPASSAHNILRRAIQTHDHYAVVAQ